jgi:hypothetical protein
MADTLKKLGNGTLGNTSGTLYTVPALTTTIVKEITLCNKSGVDVTATVTFDGTNIVGAKSIAAHDTLVIELHSILEAGDIIAGLAGATTSIDYTLSGIEVA